MSEKIEKFPVITRRFQRKVILAIGFSVFVFDYVGTKNIIIHLIWLRIK